MAPACTSSSRKASIRTLASAVADGAPTVPIISLMLVAIVASMSGLCERKRNCSSHATALGTSGPVRDCVRLWLSRRPLRVGSTCTVNGSRPL